MQSYGESRPESSVVLRSEEPPRTEEELLEREELIAREELRAAARNLGDEALEAADLRGLVGRHPLTTVAIGALSGFLLARPVFGLVRRVNVRTLGAVAGRVASLAGLASALSKGSRRVYPRRGFH